jgi:hypothetical protein
MKFTETANFIPGVRVGIFSLAQQPPVGQDLLTIEASPPHYDTPHSAGFLRTGDQPDAETSNEQHSTRHLCLRRHSNPPSQAQTYALVREVTVIGVNGRNIELLSIFVTQRILRGRQ